jgi:transposase-like protein
MEPMSGMSDEKNAERKEAMIAALAEGATWEEAAERVGVSDRTLYRWCAADPDLAARAAKARDAADDMVEAITFRNCCDPDSAHNTLRMFWLKSRRREVYGEKLEQDYKGGITIRILHADDDRHRLAPPPSGSEEDPEGTSPF